MPERASASANSAHALPWSGRRSVWRAQIRHRARGVAGHEARLRAYDPRRRVGRVVGEHGVEQRQCLGRAAALDEQHREVVLRGRIAGRERERGAQVRLRLVVAIEARQRGAELRTRDGGRRAGRGDGREARQRLRVGEAGAARVGELAREGRVARRREGRLVGRRRAARSFARFACAGLAFAWLVEHEGGEPAGRREREHQPHDEPGPAAPRRRLRRRDRRRRQRGRGRRRRVVGRGSERRAPRPAGHCFERHDDGVGVGGARRGLLGEHRHDEAHEGGRHVGRTRRQVGRRLRDVREQHLGDARRGRERRLAGAELVDDEAERVEIAAPVDRLALALLGRHVRGRAEDRARARAEVRIRLVERARDAEVEHLDVVALAVAIEQHDVLGLEIAMHDAVGLRAAQRAGDLQGDGDGARRRHAARARQLVAQRPPLEELRRDEGLPVEIADVVEPHRVRVLDGRREVHLLHEAVDDLPLTRELSVNELERDLPVHGMLDGGVDDAHAAPAEHARDRVAAARDRPADERIHGLTSPAMGTTLRYLRPRPSVETTRLLRLNAPSTCDRSDTRRGTPELTAGGSVSVAKSRSSCTQFCNRLRSEPSMVDLVSKRRSIPSTPGRAAIGRAERGAFAEEHPRDDGRPVRAARVRPRECRGAPHVDRKVAATPAPTMPLEAGCAIANRTPRTATGSRRAGLLFLLHGVGEASGAASVCAPASTTLAGPYSTGTSACTRRTGAWCPRPSSPARPRRGEA